jgi:hypothetical protein
MSDALRKIALLVPLLLVAAAPAQPLSLVVCAPGYPGTTAEAQAAMGSLSAALTGAAKWPTSSLSAGYFPTEPEGMTQLAQPSAALALVPLPFFLAHQKALTLEPKLAVETLNAGTTEQWTLVAKKGRVKSPGDLKGLTVSSVAGYAPSFVRGAVAQWGAIPDTVPVEVSTRILSTLHKIAAGQPMAALLNGEQTAALSTLPFGADLEIVARSKPVSTAVLTTVGGRLPDKYWAELERAFLALEKDEKGKQALTTLRIKRFVHLDAKTLSASLMLDGTGK